VTDGLVLGLTTLAPETVLRSTLYLTILCQFYILRLPKPHSPVVMLVTKCSLQNSFLDIFYIQHRMCQILAKMKLLYWNLPLALSSWVSTERNYESKCQIDERMELSLKTCAYYHETDYECVRRIQDDLIFYEGLRTTCIVTWYDNKGALYAEAVADGEYIAICGSTESSSYQTSQTTFQDSCINASFYCQSDDFPAS